MAEFLFVLWDGAGAVTVELRLVRALVARGHHVTVVGPASIEREIGPVGCAFVADPTGPRYDAVIDYPPDELAWLRDHVWFGNAPAQAEHVLAQARRLAPDVVVCDWLMYPSMAAAEAYGRPTAAMLPGLYGLNARKPPYSQFWDAGLGALNQARSTMRLPALASVFDQANTLDRFLVLTVRELDDEGVRLPDNARYAGPVLEPAGEPIDNPFQGSVPLVLVSFSTSNMEQGPALQRVLDGLSGLPVRTILTSGPAISTSQFLVPPNATVQAHLRHGAVLPQCAAVVTHGGHGTVVAALSHGVPLVCMPMGRDQHHVSARVAALGAGLVIDASCSAAEISGAVREVLREPSYKAGAAKIQAAIRASDGQVAVRELEGLAERAS